MSYTYNKGKKLRRNENPKRKPKHGHRVQQGQHSFRNFDKLAPLKEFLAAHGR